MPDRVYLDWNATTPLRPEARAAMAAAWDISGNPSSVHAEGRKARRLVEEARASVATAVSARPQDVVFSSGGTEANMLALTPGLRRGTTRPVERLLVSAIEHASVVAGGRFPAEAIGSIGVTRSGLVDLDHLRTLLDGGPPALVSVMLANNETGAIQPVAEAADIVHAAGGLLHVDAIQALGKIPVDSRRCRADLTDAVGAQDRRSQGRRRGGPGRGRAGARAAAARRRAGAGAPGGDRERCRDLRRSAPPSTPRWPVWRGDAVRIRGLRDRLEDGLGQTPDVIVFSQDVQRLPNTVLFTVPGLKAETAVIGFDLGGIAVSSGSACSSGKVQPSHVLAAMGVGPDLAQGAVRLSLGWSTTEADIDLALQAWRKLADALLRGRRNTA